MAKVFTITQGLENMGALKTGGQGSVYKGRRIGEIITAIKLMPTPIYTESVEDKNYRDFQNEVQKLKEVNKTPNPNVVKILSSGLTETGNFPFIEMEYIDGPDLEELLAPPLDPVFTIKEVIKVAEQLSHALAHCHRHDVKHGDIKSNNIKLNLNTGNYVLLDFGLAIMNDEQRRTSLRKAGAVEFMAPEQDNGEMMYQTDVYSFGIIIYELLAGRVPFPLTDKSESARNNVRLAHMETVPPDLLNFRRTSLPATWSQEKKDREILVPDWLLTLTYTCLRKKPDTRFANGMELHDFIIYHATQLNANQLATPSFSKVNNDIEKEQLKQQLAQYKQQVLVLQRENESLKAVKPDSINATSAVVSKFDYSQGYDANSTKNRNENTIVNEVADVPQNNNKSQWWFVMVLLAILAGALYIGYNMFYKPTANNIPPADSTNTATLTDTTTLQPPSANDLPAMTKQQIEMLRQKKADSLRILLLAKIAQQRTKDSLAKLATDTSAINNSPTVTPNDKKIVKGVQYMVVSKAYFYNAPDEATKRNIYVEPSNNAIVNAEEEQGDFVFVSFTNTKGQPSKGWLRKKDLQQVSD